MLMRGNGQSAQVFLAIVLAIVFAGTTGGADAATCTSQGITPPFNWGTAATWTCNQVPLATDDVVIADGYTVTIDTTAVAASLSITTGTGTSKININTGSLTVSGNVTLDASGINNNNNKTINVGSATLSVGGTLTLTGGAGNRTAVLSLGTGTASIGGNIAVNSAASTITFTGSGTLNVGGNFGSGALLTASTGTVVYNGAGAQSVGTYNYNNMTINKSGGTATLAGNISIAGNLNVAAGILDLSTALADRSSSGGVINVSDGATLKIGGNNTFPANYTTHTLGSTSTVEYSGSSQNATNESYGHLTLSGTGTTSLPGTALSIAGNLTLSGSATANTGAGVTVNGNLMIGSGTTFLANTYTHNVKGALSNSGTLTPGSSTFNFNGTAAQSITGPVSFFHLTIANAAGVTPSGTLTVRGNFTNSGGFNAGTSTVSFAGSSAQSITGATTFNNLTMSNASGLTINNDISVGGTLTFSSGNISTGANTVRVTATGSTSRTSGHVVGKLRKNIATGVDVSQTFEIGTGASYTPVLTVFVTVTATGDVTATTATPDHPQIATAGINSARSVNRYWTLSKDASLAFDAYAATFTFVASDVDAGSTTANFIVQRYVSPTWFSTILVAPLSTSTEGANITAMGDFAIGEPFIVSFSREKEFVFTRELY